MKLEARFIWSGSASACSRSRGIGDLPVVRDKSVRRALAESVVVEILNPKVALFFIAFLPQFVDPAASLPVWAQFLVLELSSTCPFPSADLMAVCSPPRWPTRLRKAEACRVGPARSEVRS